MRKVVNFSAGPATLPEDVLRGAQAEFLDWNHTGMGFFEMSHRDADGPVQSIMTRTVALLRNALAIPRNYQVLFTQAGAHAQMAAVPMNLARPGEAATYVCTGPWSERAAQEGAKFVARHDAVTYGAEEREQGVLQLGALPSPDTWVVAPHSRFIHICANETITGLEYLADPLLAGAAREVPVAADFTSTLLSRPVEIGRYGVIYASGGKNLGPSGFAVLIVREDLLARTPHPQLPLVLDWRASATSAPIPSISYTPPSFCIDMCRRVLEHLLANGGVEAMERRAIARAARVYHAIDDSNGFYVNGVEPASRSRMNIPFRIRSGDAGRDAQLEARFVREADAAGLLQLAGHPLVGGMRATLYNGVPDHAVEALVAFMEAFAQAAR